MNILYQRKRRNRKQQKKEELKYLFAQNTGSIITLSRKKIILLRKDVVYQCLIER